MREEIMTIDEQLLSNPDLRGRVVKYAIDSLWSIIESNSVTEEERRGHGHEEWMNLGSQLERVLPEVSLLTELGLLGVHPTHPEWVREIATL
jgi:hypothetical protein